MLRIDRDEARRIAVRAALLEAHRPPDLLALVGALAALRVELTTIVAPAHDHVAWSRLGADHHPDDLPRMLATGALFERNWYVRPMSDLGLFLAGMRSWGHRSGFDAWIEANEHFRRSILERLADQGPLTSREIPDEAAVPWQSTGWTRGQNVTRMLDGLHGRGEIAVIAHVGRLRVFDLAENVYPSDIREVPREEAVRVRSERLLAASGILREVTATWPGELHNMEIVGEPVEIDGVPGRWRVDPAHLGRPFAGRTAILSPFDRLVFARERVEALFGFEYAIEMYKPARSRRWGPFGLPILHGDQLVGKVDARAERPTGTLVVTAIHEDVPFTPAIREAVHTELEGLAAFLGLRLA